MSTPLSHSASELVQKLELLRESRKALKEQEIVLAEQLRIANERIEELEKEQKSSALSIDGRLAEVEREVLELKNSEKRKLDEKEAEKHIIPIRTELIGTWKCVYVADLQEYTLPQRLFLLFGREHFSMPDAMTLRHTSSLFGIPLLEEIHELGKIHTLESGQKMMVDIVDNRLLLTIDSNNRREHRIEAGRMITEEVVDGRRNTFVDEKCGGFEELFRNLRVLGLVLFVFVMIVRLFLSQF